MAQTKRKRRSKHRGNAAGSIEARGRTSRRRTLSPAEQKKADRAAAREARMNKPPTWNGAFFKAALMAALLFVFTQIGLFGGDTTISQSLFLVAVRADPLHAAGVRDGQVRLLAQPEAPRQARP